MMKRQTIFNIHFYLSSFFTPFLLLMAITGIFYLFGQKGSSVSTEVRTGIKLEADKIVREKQIATLIKSVDSHYRFEYLKDRGSSIQTRPTTRYYYNLKNKEDGVFALYKVTPNLLSRLIEVHKGHGPKLLKSFQKILGFGLIFIVLSGFLMSLKIKTRLKHFLGTMSLGAALLLVLFYL